VETDQSLAATANQKSGAGDARSCRGFFPFEADDWLLMVTSLAYRCRVTIKQSVTIIPYVTHMNIAPLTFMRRITVTTPSIVPAPFGQSDRRHCGGQVRRYLRSIDTDIGMLG
jgi:hypothetical protein